MYPLIEFVLAILFLVAFYFMSDEQRQQLQQLSDALNRLHNVAKGALHLNEALKRFNDWRKPKKD